MNGSVALGKSALPADDISIEFYIQWNFLLRLCEDWSSHNWFSHNEILDMPNLWKWHCYQTSIYTYICKEIENEIDILLKLRLVERVVGPCLKCLSSYADFHYSIKTSCLDPGSSYTNRLVYLYWHSFRSQVALAGHRLGIGWSTYMHWS